VLLLLKFDYLSFVCFQLLMISLLKKGYALVNKLLHINIYWIKSTTTHF
jgi:hypothetical protein